MAGAAFIGGAGSAVSSKRKGRKAMARHRGRRGKRK